MHRNVATSSCGAQPNIYIRAEVHRAEAHYLKYLLEVSLLQRGVKVALSYTQSGIFQMEKFRKKKIRGHNKSRKQAVS